MKFCLLTPSPPSYFTEQRLFWRLCYPKWFLVLEELSLNIKSRRIPALIFSYIPGTDDDKNDLPPVKMSTSELVQSDLASLSEIKFYNLN